jgi:hypothetical protein
VIFYFPPELKSSLRGTHFQSSEDVYKKMVELPEALSKNDFRRCFEACKFIWDGM